MSYENLINGFIDGSLDNAQEEALFSAIATSEELRSHFKQQLAIERTCKQYSASLAPPAQTTVGVFSALGIKIKPIADPIAAKTAGATKGTLLGKFFYGITGAIIATLLTTFVFVGYIIPDNNRNITLRYANNNISSNVDKTILNSQDIPTSVPIVTDYESTQLNSKGISQKQKVIIHRSANNEEKETKIAANNEKENLVTNIENNSIPLQELQELSILPQNVMNMSITNDSRDQFISLYKPDFSYLMNLTTIPEKLGFLVEAKGSQYYSLLNTSVPQAENVNFSNFGLNLLYKLSDNFSLGIGIRQENFPQRYEGTDELGNEFIYKQNPNLLSIGLMGRYNLFNIGQFGAFGQAELGANKAGVLGRIAVGIEFTPENVIYMNLGIEASGLRYFHNDRIFYTPKAGLFYGIGIKF